jgi:hypothetical protein
MVNNYDWSDPEKTGHYIEECFLREGAESFTRLRLWCIIKRGCFFKGGFRGKSRGGKE